MNADAITVPRQGSASKPHPDSVEGFGASVFVTDTFVDGFLAERRHFLDAALYTETVGPYPSRTDIFRSDVRENRQGTPLTLTIKVVNAASACAAVSGVDVEIWHVDAAGDYSQYGTQTAATFLRGIQTTNAAGEVTFTTIYPGWYQGRATHIHAEVTMGGRSIKVTQIAFPESVNNVVHRSGVYASPGDRAGRPPRCRVAGHSVGPPVHRPTES